CRELVAVLSLDRVEHRGPVAVDPLRRCSAPPSPDWRHPGSRDRWPRAAREQLANEMVTKMVANTRPRAGIERHATTWHPIIPNTNQHISGQNKPGWGGCKKILSQARLPIPPQGLAGRIIAAGRKGSTVASGMVAPPFPNHSCAWPYPRRPRTGRRDVRI